MSADKTRRRIEYLIILTGVLVLAFSGTANAAGMHGDWATDPGSCWTCHRAHTAISDGLLVSGLLCRTCHEGSLGADTDVINGMYADALNVNHSWGNSADRLLGGGFEYIGGSAVNSATSNHSIGQTVVPHGSRSGAYILLECTSCHSATHDFNYGRFNQYRMLRQQVGDAPGPLNVTWNGPWEGPNQQFAKGGTYMAYTDTDFSSGSYPFNPIEYTRNYESGLSAWCSGCHNVYIEPASPYDIGDGAGGTVKVRHKVEITLANTGRLMGSPATDLPLNDLGGVGRSPEDTISCVTCHRAHGTDSDATSVGAYPTAGRGFLPAMNTSMLLRRNNRGVCIDCHGYLNEM